MPHETAFEKEHILQMDIQHKIKNENGITNLWILLGN